MVQRETILIVDNHPVNMKLIRVLLTSEGYEVRTASDASEVLNILKGFRPDLILLDVQLPGIDGLELTRRLKVAPSTSSIPILGVTAHAMKGDRERILAAGCDGYIAKPIDTRALPNFIKACLNKATIQSAAE